MRVLRTIDFWWALTLGSAAIAALLLIHAPSEDLRAADGSYYVSTSGRDSASGAQSQPFRTVQKAADVAGPGDTVNITPGVYGAFTVNNSGTSSARITFQGSGAGAWIDTNCSGANAIEIKGGYITMRDFGARRSNEEVIRLTGSDYATFERMTITDWNCGEGEDQYRGGISSWGGGRSLTVRDSYLERRVDVSGSDAGYGNGIWVKNTGPGDGGGHAFIGNTIIGGWDGIGGEPEDYEWGVFNGNSTIENNTIRDCDDDGIQVEGGTHNITVARNTITGCLIGVAFAPALGGPLTIMRNVVAESQPRRGEGPAMFKAGDGSTGEVYVYHNSFYAGSVPSDGFKQTNPDLESIHLLNNAIYAGRYVWESHTHTGEVASDYDAMFSADHDRFVNWEDRRYETLPALQNGEGQEAHGIVSADFGWDNDFRLAAGSPLIDKGVHIPGVNDGFSGDAPDIGAFEFVGSGPGNPTQTPTPTAIPAMHSSGDVDCDGWVTARDTIRLMQAAAGIVSTGCVNLVDLDCDGAITAKDALAILTYIARIDTLLPTGCPYP